MCPPILYGMFGICCVVWYLWMWVCCGCECTCGMCAHELYGTYVCGGVHVWAYVGGWVCMCVCVRARVRVHVCVCSHTCVSMYWLQDFTIHTVLSSIVCPCVVSPSGPRAGGSTNQFKDRKTYSLWLDCRQPPHPPHCY